MNDSEKMSGMPEPGEENREEQDISSQSSAGYPDDEPAAFEEAMADDAYPYSEAATTSEASTTGNSDRMRLITIIVSVVLVVVLVGVTVGYVFFGRQNQTADTTQVIAKVGDLEVTRGEFLRNYTPGDSAEETLDQIIDFKLVVHAAREAGQTADETEIDQQIEQLRSQHGNPEDFTTFLQEVNIESEEDLRRLLGELQLFNTMLLDHTIVEQAHARHILLQVDSEAALADRKAEAEELLAQIQGGADFAQLAQEHSEDPGSGQQGGDLGWAPRGVFVPSFDEAIFSMEPGEVRLVESQFGWHIIELQEPREQRPIENPDFMRSTEAQEAFTSWIDSLRTEAEQNDQIDILVSAPDLVPPMPTLAPLPTTQP